MGNLCLLCAARSYGGDEMEGDEIEEGEKVIEICRQKGQLDHRINGGGKAER